MKTQLRSSIYRGSEIILGIYNLVKIDFSLNETTIDNNFPLNISLKIKKTLS
jgi:hypothetical protein